ncbi:MAG TPA: class I SAM-dependent methyltransferase [Thermoanaerobaculia bacterium]|nr:class I SAM-dependent methyltransferase [Thermoanaerobaculia bacterium]
MPDYYARRLSEYDAIYAKPERQADLEQLRSAVARAFVGDRVLELACGTAYWTPLIAEVAHSVLATDAAISVTNAACGRVFPSSTVSFVVADAFSLPVAAGRFTAIFAGFWWSHVPRERLPEFLAAISASVGLGVKVVFIDNRFVPGSSTPISRADSAGNTYQVRTLSDRAEVEILKNFPNAAELRSAAATSGTDLEITELQYYWWLSYRTRPAGSAALRQRRGPWPSNR